MATATATAIGYIRVSTEGQATDGVSLDAQRAKIEAWVLLNDYELVAVHVDAGISGKGMANRPGLQNALADCRKGSALVVYSLSRLARSTKDTIEISERLNKSGADLVSLSEKIDTTSAAGKMVFRMMAVLAEFERDQISERTATAMQFKKAKGELVGAVPYGFEIGDDGKTLVKNSIEQDAITFMRELHAKELSLRNIAGRLLKAGYQPRAKAWYPASIAKILKEAA
jgi:DNA invertase Pin-like site-specific DNA recombinase